MDFKSEVMDSMMHCGNIASSAIVLAAERSDDIEVPFIITLMMLKKLCEENIKEQRNIDIVIPKHLQGLANSAGLNVDEIEEKGFKAMEKLLDDYFKWQEFKKAKVGQ